MGNKQYVVFDFMGKLVIKKRHALRKSDANRLKERLYAEIGTEAEQYLARSIEVAETNSDTKIYLVDKKPFLLEMNKVIFPTLYGALEFPMAVRQIVVDMGAVSFVVNGADIMRPGVIAVASDVKQDHPVVIVDERHKKPLAIGTALYNADELMAQTSGKVVKTWHYVGDEIWNLAL